MNCCPAQPYWSGPSKLAPGISKIAIFIFLKKKKVAAATNKYNNRWKY